MPSQKLTPFVGGLVLSGAFVVACSDDPSSEAGTTAADLLEHDLGHQQRDF